MAILNDALNDALNHYNGNQRALRNETREVGCALFERGGKQLNSKLVYGDTKGNEIRLYEPPNGSGFDVMKSYLTGDPIYVGDYHTHVNGSAYPKELPSDTDLFLPWGIMCDLCPIQRIWNWFIEHTKGLEALRGVESIPVRPQFQLIQPARFGDIIVATAVEGRHQFADVDEQKEVLEPQADKYRKYIRSTGALGSIQEDRAGYRGYIRGYISTINGMIGDRAILRYVENAKAPKN